MKQLLSTSILILACSLVFSQDFQPIIDLVNHGDGMGLVAHMDAEVDVLINDESETYDRNAAGKRMVEFFHEHPVKSFNVVHKGASKGGVNYLIGQMESESSSFRTTIYIKVENDDHRIQSIELEEG